MMLTTWQPPRLTGRSASFMGGGVVLIIIIVMVVSAVLEAKKGPESNLIPGDPLPDYAAVSADGSEFSIGELRGKVVLLSFWATWCSECVHQLPALQQLNDEYADQGLELVSVSLDDQDPAWVKDYLDAGGHDWLNLSDEPEHMQEVFGWGRGVPKTILVNRDGTVAVWWRGRLDAGDPENRELIEDAISGKAVWSPGS
jgi:peroxiredoxin